MEAKHRSIGAILVGFKALGELWLCSSDAQKDGGTKFVSRPGMSGYNGGCRGYSISIRIGLASGLTYRVPLNPPPRKIRLTHLQVNIIRLHLQFSSARLWKLTLQDEARGPRAASCQAGW